MKICAWCGVRLTGWRRLWAEHCRECSLRMQDCGIYLQCGGPAYPYMSRLPTTPTTEAQP